MHGRWQDQATEDEAVRIAADIERQGFGVLSGYVSEAELAPIREVAQRAVEASGGEYTGFNGTQAFRGTVLAELPQNEAFKSLCRRLYELGTGERAPDVEFYQIFRCLQGRSGQAHSYRFHYDSYVLTALLPVVIPNAGRRGDLLVLPNTRRVRRLYLTNLLDKLLVDNALSQRILRAAARRRRLNTVAITMQPGNIYFFWGYRSVHTNEPCDPDKLRATALLHYGDPHRNSRARQWLRGKAATAA